MRMPNTFPAAFGIAVVLFLPGAALFAADAPVVPLQTAVAVSTEATPAPVEKRYLRATGETIIFGWSPWLYSHFIKDYPYADISVDTVKRNFSNPPWWDADNFHTNLWGHPFQGSMYYNAARENGFNFWESAPFVALGDFGWEYIMETEPPSYNDFSNTFFGGMSRGEMTYRLSVAVRDNRAHGWEKFWREVGAGFVNPVGFLDRAIFGDMCKDAPNPPDRLPAQLTLMVDAGYAHGRASSAYPNQGIFNFNLRYNDPHDTPIKKPFDYFDLYGTVSTANGPLIPLIHYRGLLAGWDLVDEENVHHMISPGLTFDYFNNGPTSFGGSGLDLTLLSRWKLAHAFDLRTEVGAQGYIAAGIQTDYAADSVNATGRNYDFGTGGGPKVDIRLRRDNVDWFSASATIGWLPTNNGLSSESRIILVSTAARYPLTRDLYAGVSWSFQERFTLYSDLPQVIKTNSIIQGFFSYAFRIIGD